MKKDQNTEPATPYCSRPEDPDKLMKVFKAAKTPLDLKYDGTENADYTLSLFAALALQHLEMHGMDSVFYFEKEGIEYNLLTHFPLFTIADIEKATMAMKDPFDQANLKWSKQFLFDSLSMNQQLKIAKHSKSNLNGPMLWMNIVLENQSDSFRALRTVQHELEAMALTKYPGENVKACTKDIDMKCRRLEAAQSLPKDIGGTVCNILTQCSVEAFRMPFHTKFWELDKKPDCYSYQDLIRDADALYLSLLAADKWLAKTSDEETVLSGLVAKVDQLVLQNQGGGRGRNRGGRGRGRGRNRGRGGRGQDGQDSTAQGQTGVTCWNCGKKGHISSKCPDKANADNASDDDWKKKPPKKGEAHEKEVNGQTWKWCGRCPRWTLSHSTADHKDGVGTDPAGHLASGEVFVSQLTMRG